MQIIVDIIITMLFWYIFRYPDHNCGYFVFNIPNNFHINMEIVIVIIPVTVIIMLSILKNSWMLFLYKLVTLNNKYNIIGKNLLLILAIIIIIIILCIFSFILITSL
jgi:hypothetical protein